MSNQTPVLNGLKRLWDRLPQEVKGDYREEYMEKYYEVLDRRLKQLDRDLMKVVRCMDHAISAVHPQTLWLLLSYMKTCITDRFFLNFNPKLKVSTLK